MSEFRRFTLLLDTPTSDVSFCLLYPDLSDSPSVRSARSSSLWAPRSAALPIPGRRRGNSPELRTASIGILLIWIYNVSIFSSLVVEFEHSIDYSSWILCIRMLSPPAHPKPAWQVPPTRLRRSAIPPPRLNCARIAMALPRSAPTIASSPSCFFGYLSVILAYLSAVLLVYPTHLPPHRLIANTSRAIDAHTFGLVSVGLCVIMRSHTPLSI